MIGEGQSRRDEGHHNCQPRREVKTAAYATRLAQTKFEETNSKRMEGIPAFIYKWTKSLQKKLGN
jgi:hypothetical protein